MSISESIYAIDELAIFNAINDYKLYGKNSYVFKDKALLDAVYKYTEISMNDSDLIGDTIEYLLGKGMSLGEILSKIKGAEPYVKFIPNFDDLRRQNFKVDIFAESPLIDAISNKHILEEMFKTSQIVEAIIKKNPEKFKEILLNPKYLYFITGGDNGREHPYPIHNTVGSTMLYVISQNVEMSEFVINSDIILNAIIDSNSDGDFFRRVFYYKFLDILAGNTKILDKFIERGVLEKAINFERETIAPGSLNFIFENRNFSNTLFKNNAFRKFAFTDMTISKCLFGSNVVRDIIFNSEEYFSEIMSYPATYTTIFESLGNVHGVITSYTALKVMSHLSDDVIKASKFNSKLYDHDSAYETIFNVIQSNLDRINVVRSNANADINYFNNPNYYKNYNMANPNNSHSESNPPSTSILRITGITNTANDSCRFTNLERQLYIEFNSNVNTNIKKLSWKNTGEETKGFAIELFIFGSASMTFTRNSAYPHSVHYVLT